MQFTAFAEFGQFTFTGAPCLSQRIYETIWANLGDNYARDGYTDAKVYATAMALARMVTTQTRLDAQIDPATVLELLPDREREHGLIVPATATIASRRAALTAQARLPNGGTRPNVMQALTDLLGADFLSLNETAQADAVTYPVTPNTPGNFVKPSAPRRLFRLSVAVTAPGELNTDAVPWLVENLDGTTPTLAELPTVGEWLMVEPEHNTLLERVQVVASEIDAGQAQIYGTLTNPHHQYARVLAGPWPLWASTKRFTQVRVEEAAALDGPTRRSIDELLAKLFRAVSTWAVAGNDGPYELDASPLDITPFGP